MVRFLCGDAGIQSPDLWSFSAPPNSDSQIGSSSHTQREREREKKRIAVCNIRKERGNKGTSYENGVGRNGKFYEVSSFPGQR